MKKLAVHLGSTVPLCGIVLFFVAIFTETFWLVFVTLVCLLVGCAFENTATDAMWSARRKRWIDGGYDPAYPKKRPEKEGRDEHKD